MDEMEGARKFLVIDAKGNQSVVTAHRYDLGGTGDAAFFGLDEMQPTISVAHGTWSWIIPLDDKGNSVGYEVVPRE